MPEEVARDDHKANVGTFLDFTCNYLRETGQSSGFAALFLQDSNNLFSEFLLTSLFPVEPAFLNRFPPFLQPQFRSSPETAAYPQLLSDPCL